jgi:hypothetical protein
VAGAGKQGAYRNTRQAAHAGQQAHAQVGSTQLTTAGVVAPSRYLLPML